jgi:hypothetical protein
LKLTAGGSGGSFGLVSDNGSAVLRFYSYTAGAERMRIDSSGNLLVGTTSSGLGTARFVVDNGGANIATIFQNTGATSASVEISRYYHIAATGATSATYLQFLNSSGAGVGTITCNGTATSYNTSSDYRLKENIAPMTGALGVVSALKPVTYTWKADGSDGQGFIAHELQAVVPDCVSGEKDAVDAEGKPQYQGIDTSFLVATLTAAIQELKAIVDAQAVRIAALEA